MDGVLADTEPMNQQAQDAVLARRGAVLGEAEYARLVGLSNDASWDWLIARFALTDTLDTLVADYVASLIPRLNGLSTASGVAELIGALRSRQVPMAVASASPRGAVDAVLAALGLRDAFDAVVCDDDVAAGKPAPDLFRLAAARVGVSPAGCLVIEDSPHGVQAARAAGMRVLAVRTRYNVTADLSGAVVIDSLAALVPAQDVGLSGTE